MPKLKLTDAAIQRFKAPQGERIEYFDATLPGFGLRVSGPTSRTPEGRKSWVLFYRYGGEQKRLTIDPPYPALGLAEARKQAGDALQLLAAGKDPSAAKAAGKAETLRQRDTVQKVVAEFLKKGLEDKKRSKGYLTETRRNFDNHVLPRWAARDLKAITRRDVIELLDGIAEGGTERKTPTGTKSAAGGPIAANRVLSAVRAMCNWALRRGILEANPCALVEPPGEETRRERTLTADEIRELWPVFGTLGYPFGDFLKLSLILGQRRGEVAGMLWSELDFEAKTWTLAADRTKAARLHVVPLPQMAVDLLRALPRKSTTVNGPIKPSPYVFTSDGAAPISGFSDAKERVEGRVAKARQADGAGPFAPWSIHDLRRTCATEMGRLGTAEFVIGKVLNHAARGITGQVYNRYEYLAEKRQALDGWAAYLESLTTTGRQRVAGGPGSSANTEGKAFSLGTAP